MLSCRTNEEMFVCLKYDLTRLAFCTTWDCIRSTYARTFENSDDGDMTKLSFVFDHEMRCDMLWSSSMLCRY